MKLSVKNAKDLELTKLIKLAAKFYSEILLDENIINDLILTITIQKTNAIESGVCLTDDKDPARKFNIEIARFRKKSLMLRILAHEMVHLKQYAYNELYEHDLKTYWHGKVINLMYWDQPWEIEAYGLENGLFAKFINKYDLFKQLNERRSAWSMDC